MTSLDSLTAPVADHHAARRRGHAAAHTGRTERQAGATTLRPLLAAAACLTVGLSTGDARADEECAPAHGLSTCVVADNLWPQAGTSPWLSLGPTTAAAPGGVGFGFVASYLSRPIGLQIASADPEGTTVYAVDNVLDATFVLSAGLSKRLELTLAAPIVLFQDGASTADVVGSDEFLPRSAFGDLRFGVRAHALPRQGPEGVGLSGRLEIVAPTGNPSAFVTTGTAQYVPGLSFDHQIGRFHWGLDGSVRIRETRELAGARLGSQVVTAAGASVDILDGGWLSTGLEAFALFTLVDQYTLQWDAVRLRREAVETEQMHIPAEWMLSVRSAGLLDGQLQTALAGGSFIPTGSESPVTTPRFRFALSVQYTPSTRARSKGDEVELEQEQEPDSVVMP